MRAFFAVFRHELTRIMTVRSAFMVMIVAALVYAVFYPQPYLTEALRDVPLALVDRDGTNASRDFARRLDASADVQVAQTLPDLPSAERAVYDQTVSGILVIPQGFERDLLRGRPSPVALYADAGYFLIFQRLSTAVSTVARTVGTDVESARLIALGTDPAITGAAVDPLPLTAVPLFNPQSGYATYVLPAAFVLILQQLLLIGVGVLGTTPDPARPKSGPMANVLGKASAYLLIEAVILPAYLVILTHAYGVPRLGPVTTILIFALPFILSVAFLGLIVSALFRGPLAVQLAAATVGMPFFFLAGFSWPLEAMPAAVRWGATLVPSSVAIDGLVRIAQLGAPLTDVSTQFLTLWGLTIVYGGIAMGLAARKPN